MLVLSRKVGEEIIINGNIRLKIVQVDGNKVRIGITAPPEISVDRQEIHDKKQEWQLPLTVAAVLARPAVLAAL